MSAIRVGSLVRWRGRPTIYRVEDLVHAIDTHSSVPIWDAVIKPVSDTWIKDTRRVRASELTPAPCDLEDWPCSPV
jgi:hypothetical protein